MGVYQHELARAAGISIASYRRLERDEVTAAPLWWYVNCAIALNLPLEDLLDDRLLDWRPTKNALAPPEQAFLADRHERARGWAEE
jgi:transcriptional regulator with XRE-family HTH domain